MIRADGQGLAFILSTPRAGSTLLAAMLGSHSRVMCPPEPWLLLPLASLQNRRLLATAAYDHAFAQLASSELMSEVLADRAMVSYALTAYNGLLAEGNKAVLVDKTPRYYHILDVIDRLFPQALQIWLQRSPLDTIASCLDTWRLSMSELMGDVISPYTFDATISFRLLADHFQRAGPTRISIRYEDLVVDPSAHLSAICERLGQVFEPAMLEYGRAHGPVGAYRRATMGDKKLLESERPHTASIGRWRMALSPRDVRHVLDVLGTRIFEQMGYADQLQEALDYASVDPVEISGGGQLVQIAAALESYGSAVDARLVGRVDVQYTLLGRQYAEALATARTRLDLIEQLDASTKTLRADGEAKERVIAELHTVNEAAVRRPESIPPPAFESSQVRDALEEQQCALERLTERIEELQSTYSAYTDLSATGYLNLLRSSHTREIGAMEARTEALALALEQAQSVSTARLAVIEQQQRAIQAYQRWRPADWLRSLLQPRLGVLYQYAPRALEIPRGYSKRARPISALSVSVLTSPANQDAFLEQTIRSVLDQHYPRLEYLIARNPASDAKQEIASRDASNLSFVDSSPGLVAGAVLNRGFAQSTGDIMALLSSNSLLLPQSLLHVTDFFERHPDVDVLYGNRIVIDESDAEIGRWILPPHDDQILSWANFIPTETLFWRRSIWERSGGRIDETFRFAFDWEMLLRFRKVGAKMVRLPRFLGAVRVHPDRPTSVDEARLELEETARLRCDSLGRRVTPVEVQRSLRPYLRKHLACETLYRLGVFRY